MQSQEGETKIQVVIRIIMAYPKEEAVKIPIQMVWRGLNKIFAKVPFIAIKFVSEIRTTKQRGGTMIGQKKCGRNI